MRTLYTIAFFLTLPLIVARLFWRSVRQRGYRKNLGERFGRYGQPALDDCIWIHAVSVGETRAAEPLIRSLKALYPTRQVLLTGMTPTGRATAQELFGNAVTSVYLPYDFVALHERLFAHFRPSILLIMETEIWPNLLHACDKNAIPALMVNARLSEKSAHGYARFALVRDLLQQALRSVRVVAAQSAADAERFSALGANAVVVTGNIKFDVILDPALVLAGERGRAAQLERRVLLCASTREGEETLLLSAYLQIFDAAARRDTLLVIVPRHPQRFDQVADDITRVALRVSRRSQAGPDLTEVLSCEVLLGDSMGEMATYYAFSDVVIIGGSFLPLGGQNLIEACSLGKPVIMGPSTYNFADAVRLARDAGALLQGADAVAAMRTAHCLLQDGNSRTKMSVAGRRLVDENRGATEKTLELIASVLEKNHSG